MPNIYLFMLFNILVTEIFGYVSHWRPSPSISYHIFIIHHQLPKSILKENFGIAKSSLLSVCAKRSSMKPGNEGRLHQNGGGSPKTWSFLHINEGVIVTTAPFPLSCLRSPVKKHWIKLTLTLLVVFEWFKLALTLTFDCVQLDVMCSHAMRDALLSFQNTPAKTFLATFCVSTISNACVKFLDSMHFN